MFLQPDVTVKDIKNKIEKIEGIEPSQQRLTCMMKFSNGTEGSKQLEVANIHHTISKQKFMFAEPQYLFRYVVFFSISLGKSLQVDNA